jgi:vanillate O-demethylase monooxygenase subunit
MGGPVATVVDNETAALARGWHVVAMSAEVGSEPLGVQLLGREWVLARVDGDLVAFLDRCPHRFAPLSAGRVVGGALQCPYHGWEFGRDGKARCTPSQSSATGSEDRIPPRACLTPPAGLVERFGLVWLAPEPPVCDLHAFPEWDDAACTRAWNEPRRTAVSAVQLTDNFLDASHFPFVHPGTFGTPEAEEVSQHEVTRSGWEVRTVNRAPYRNHDDPLVATGEHPLVQPHVLTKVGRPPCAVYLTLDFPLTGARLVILFACQPERNGSTRVYKMMARHGYEDSAAALADLVAYEDDVLSEDLALLGTYHSMTLATDLRVEVHAPSDKLSVAYRRLLAELFEGAQP